MLLIAVRKDGELLELGDRSQWRVRGSDITIARSWLPDAEIQATEQGNRSYLLVNRSTWEAVHAVPVTDEPEDAGGRPSARPGRASSRDRRPEPRPIKRKRRDGRRDRRS